MNVPKKNCPPTHVEEHIIRKTKRSVFFERSVHFLKTKRYSENTPTLS